ncbi:hypothetical protein C1H46_019733 [Malus baccata]|uniref:Uncharacterized protein n=1 Tax=Malus baccata TaxID=106549 RepID=A0A540M7E7_MALBA|nr:hypothetical protein C1H46_019733 [Malus baccata]
MDSSRFAESFDSLWFFGNVFSSKPMSPIVQNQRTEPPPVAEMSIPMCPKGDEPETVEPGSVQLVVEYYDSQSQRSTVKAKRRRRRRKKGLQRNKRKILGEFEMSGFDDRAEEVSYGNFWSSNRTVDGNCGFNNQRFGKYPSANYGMPSISDKMAMKEHLKSWAYAVACTVIAYHVN